MQVQVWFFVTSTLFKSFLTFQNSMGRTKAVTTATTKSDIFFSAPVDGTFKSDPSSWCCLRHLVYLTSFHENEKKCCFSLSADLYWCVIETRIVRNRDLLFWGSGVAPKQDESKRAVRAFGYFRTEKNLFIAERYYKKNNCKFRNCSTLKHKEKFTQQNESLP